MNVLLIVSDTLRKDHLGCYGNKWISTPCLDRFARECVIFDRAYVGSFPTVPNRRDIMTGRYVFTYAGWEPLGRQEVVLAEALGAAGYTTMMISDTPHTLQYGYHFDRGFSGWEWIRGQENDRWMTSPARVNLPCDPAKLRGGTRIITQYLRNVSERRSEEDYFVGRTMSRACEWLSKNHKRGKFFLYVDTFDPHEPWDPPRWCVDLYDPGYKGQEVIYPVYGRPDFLSKRELKHMRALYAGEVTLVDKWAGVLLAKLEALGVMDETVVIFTTDHGFYLGEHGLVGKALISPGLFQYVALYREVAEIPLLVRLPGARRRGRSRAVVQPWDLMPTILELVGVHIPPRVQGSSFAAVLEGKRSGHRKFAVSSPSITGPPNPTTRSTITCDGWTLIYGGRRATSDEIAKTAAVDSQLRTLTLPDHDVRQELYHLPSDPAQKRNLFSRQQGVAARLHRMYLNFLGEAGTAGYILEARKDCRQETKRP